MRYLFLFCLSIFTASALSAQTYNTLAIPDTLSGTNFELTIRDTFKQIHSGNQTITGGINGDFWGPTLFVNKGDTVHMNVHNTLNDSTTIHWHGMHLPAVMDGGPHQIIPPGTLWQPYWKVTNKASTYWYHPHLHQMTQAQLIKGIGGFLIVRDSEEAALPIPRHYGIDDIPLVLTSRRYVANNQFDLTNVYGDYMLTNGTENAQVTLPAQVVRLRILNAEIERAYILGFSDNRTFYVIGNDGGLLDTPVAVQKLTLLVGERVEILVDLSKATPGTSFDMQAFNGGQTLGFPGGEPQQNGQFGSLLNNKTFNILHINVGAATTSPIMAIPSTLVHNTYLTANDATVSRTLAIDDHGPGTPFQFDGQSFVFNTINKTLALGTTEKWTVTNGRTFGHSFHIHDVEFKIISRSGGPVASYEQGWKDVFYIPVNSSVTFVAKFDDYSDPIHPFMYHCHFADHEDGGLMGQFVVTDQSSVPSAATQEIGYSLYPNPASNRLFVHLDDSHNSVYYITITTVTGRTVMMLPQPDLSNGIDISSLPAGSYMVRLMDKDTKQVTIRKFIKE